MLQQIFLLAVSQLLILEAPVLSLVCRQGGDSEGHGKFDATLELSNFWFKTAATTTKHSFGLKWYLLDNRSIQHLNFLSGFYLSS